MDPEIALSFEALTKDATLWDAASATLQSSAGEIAGIEVNRGAFSFAAIDLADLYAELHSRVQQLLTDGANRTSEGADALRAVRDQFERYEDITQSELYRIWQPAV
ncbi:hypothetical protein [Microbacterium paraoxydans]|uniref:hypothetical protein n=1 Tax=Microbacterium paraoxydans TaxID=199592 RepID=UPI0021A631C6|nr:hypothetical protein [Microbacterium paraoxydans]MCT2223364.1 hypothetical protein [Microbacterium paraoxydans]